MNDIDIILKLVLGNEGYQELITYICQYFKNNKYCRSAKNLENIFPITEACLIAIFLIGISKKPVNMDEYMIKLSNNKNMIMETKKLCKDFDKYIKAVEEFKNNMLRKIT